MKKLVVNDCGFAHLTLILLRHYLVKCRSRSLAVYNNKFILGSTSISASVITFPFTTFSVLCSLCARLNTHSLPASFPVQITDHIIYHIGQNIKSRKRPSVRPATVDKILTLFMDRSSPNLEHSFPVSYMYSVLYFFCTSASCGE